MKRWLGLALGVALACDSPTAPAPEEPPWDEIAAFYAGEGRQQPTPFHAGTLTLTAYPTGWYESVCDYSKLYADALMCGGGGAGLALGQPIKNPYFQTFVYLTTTTICVRNAVESRCVTAPQTVGDGAGGGGGGSWY